jgi:transposase
MLSLPPSVQLYVATEPVDGRKGIDGLSVYVQSVLRMSPLCGHLFIFFNRRHDQVRILYWDRSGYALWQKRLERGRFALTPKLLDPQGPASIEAAELGLILEGITLAGAHKRPRWEPMDAANQ